MSGRRAWLAIGVISAVVLAAGLYYACTHAHQAQGRLTSSAEPVSDDSAPTITELSVATGPAGRREPSASADAEQRQARAVTPPPARLNTVARAAAGRDEHDLELLSSIERELGRSPPPELGVLIQRRHQGASREELLELIQTTLPADFPLRALAARWARAVFGGPHAGPSPLGRGVGRRTVQNVDAR